MGFIAAELYHIERLAKKIAQTTKQFSITKDPKIERELIALEKDIKLHILELNNVINGNLPRELYHDGNINRDTDDLRHSFGMSRQKSYSDGSVRPYPENNALRAEIIEKRKLTNSQLAQKVKETIKTATFFNFIMEYKISRAEIDSYIDMYLDHLLNGDGSALIDNRRVLSNSIASTYDSLMLKISVQGDFQRGMQHFAGDFVAMDKLQGQNGYKLPRFSLISNPTLAAIIGSAQDMSMRLVSINYIPAKRYFYGIIVVKITAIFGVSEADVMRQGSYFVGKEGVTDFFILQNDRDRKSFPTIFEFSIPVSGNY